MTRANVVQQYLAVAILAADSAGLGLRSAFAHRRSHQTSWRSLALSPAPCCAFSIGDCRQAEQGA
jgi:hypothetical protein